jgi:hypothetical protein
MRLAKIFDPLKRDNKEKEKQGKGQKGKREKG